MHIFAADDINTGYFIRATSSTHMSINGGKQQIPSLFILLS
jgi:hypothetical protein